MLQGMVLDMTKKIVSRSRLVAVGMVKGGKGACRAPDAASLATRPAAGVRQPWMCELTLFSQQGNAAIPASCTLMALVSVYRSPPGCCVIVRYRHSIAVPVDGCQLESECTQTTFTRLNASMGCPTKGFCRSLTPLLCFRQKVRTHQNPKPSCN